VVIYSTDRPVCSAVSSAMRRLSWPSLGLASLRFMSCSVAESSGRASLY
jgi:hypothetical protein